MKLIERAFDKSHSPKPLAYFINDNGPSSNPDIFRTVPGIY